MPVILRKEREQEWLSGDISLLKRKHILLPVDDSDLEAHTVAPILGHAGANPSDPGIILPYNFEITGNLF